MLKINKYIITKLYKYLLVASFICMFDLISKIHLDQAFNLYDTVEITSFLRMFLVYNPGVAFSMFADWQYSRYFFVIVSLFACFFIINLLYDGNKK